MLFGIRCVHATIGPSIISGADLPERQADAARSAKEGRLIKMFVVAERAS
jgi:hypothetical protein